MHNHDPASYDWNDCYSGTADDYEPPDELVLATVRELSPGRALDVGCGAGGLLVELAQRGWEVTGIDLAKNAISAAEKVFAKRGLQADLHSANAARWKPKGSYDLITNCFALPGTRDDQRAAMVMMKDALAPGGTVVLKDFDEGMKKHAGVFGAFHHPTVEEITEAFEGLEIVRAEVVDTPAHHHGGHTVQKEDWTAIVFVARKPPAA